MANGWHPLIHRDYDGRSRRCTVGLHPGDNPKRGACEDGDFAERQCCVRTPCQRHKCGPRKGCNCPLPEAATAEAPGGGEAAEDA